MAKIIQAKSVYTRYELFEIWQTQGGKDVSEKNKHLQNEIVSIFSDKSEIEIRGIVKNLSRFTSELTRRWGESYRNKEVFLKKNEKWLEQKITVYSREHSATPSTSRGRPSVPFEEGSEKSKRRKTKELTDKFSTPELSYATQINLRKEGQSDAAKLLKEALETTPTRASKIRTAWTRSDKQPVPLTPEEGLSLLIEAGLSKKQYNLIRLQAKNKNADIYPSYNKIRQAKEHCYPSVDTTSISEVLMEVKLQPLLDHTISRIALAQEEVFQNIVDDNTALTLISKWGCDGSTGHSQYKQRLREGTSDEDIFLTSLVPLQLFRIKKDHNKEILWHNPRPSSVRYCRPIRIQFQKETSTLAQEEVKYIEDQIKNLLPSRVTVHNKEYIISHELALTMIDGKICNAVSSIKSAQICYICKATPKQMNDIQRIVAKDVNPMMFRFGLSTLHAWIRFFECLLHVSYRLPFKSWQARGKHKEEMQARKTTIQQRFREEMGLLVDQVKPGGSGTSNDGNTARKFFRDPEKSAKITGINLEIIKRFAVILQTLSSGFTINKERFAEYSKKTAALFIEEYKWFYMPASVHKILIHGADIIDSAILPIGQLSEEAQECRNKDLKFYRRAHTRKTSRYHTNADLLHCLLVSSDPYITSLRALPKKPHSSLSKEVLSLLDAPNIGETPSELDIFATASTSTASSSEDSDSDSDFDL